MTYNINLIHINKTNLILMIKSESLSGLIYEDFFLFQIAYIE